MTRPPLKRRIKNPPDRQGLLPVLGHDPGDVIKRACDPHLLHLAHGLHVLQGVGDDLDRVVLGPGQAVEGLVHDGSNPSFFPLLHAEVDELFDQLFFVGVDASHVGEDFGAVVR